MGVPVVVHVASLLRQRGLGGRQVGPGLTVRPQVHETDLAQGRLADHVHRASELPPVDRDLLVLPHKLELLDRRPDRGLPGEPVAGRGHDLLGRHRVARHHALGHQAPLLDLDQVRVAHPRLHVVAEADGAALGGDAQPGQVHDHRKAPPEDPHGPARVGDHVEAGQARLAVGARLTLRGGLDGQGPRLAHQLQVGLARGLGLALAHGAALGCVGILLDHGRIPHAALDKGLVRFVRPTRR